MAQEHENDWLASLYQQSYTRLYRVAYRQTGDSETARELTQDVFALALTRREKLLTHPQPEAWLMKTLTNLIKNERRRLSTTEISLETQLHIAAPGADAGLLEVLPPKLPAEDREVLTWRFEQQLDYKEIADRLGISETGSRSRVFRALERCRKLLGRNGPPT